MQRYDMVFEVGTDIKRDFAWDVNHLGDRGLMDFDFKMQIRHPITTNVIKELTRANGKLIPSHSHLFMVLQETEIFDLSGLENKYVSEILPSPDNPTTFYGPTAVYDLISISPEGVYTRELSGNICFNTGVTHI